MLRHEPPGAPDAPRLALVGKGVTFDAGGYFLKSRPDIVRQKADMAGGAAVVAALGAIAELGLPLSVTGVVPACENMLSGTAIRPTDVITTAAGLTVEVTNPDAEGRLILADALWWARRDGATHLVDLATLTGAMHEGMGDMYAGVFANDDAWRDAVVDAGNAGGDLAWPWPLHPRYRPLIDSTVADLRNNAGKKFGFPIVAATFLREFAGEGPWAHVDMLGTAIARGRSRRRVRPRRDRLRRPHARRARRAPERRGELVSFDQPTRKSAPAATSRPAPATRGAEAPRATGSTRGSQTATSSPTSASSELDNACVVASPNSEPVCSPARP